VCSLQCRNRRRNDLSLVSRRIHERFPLQRWLEVLSFLLFALYPLYDFDLRATHSRTLLPAALASVLFGFVLVRARILNKKSRNQKKPVTRHKPIAPGVLAKDLKAITSVVLRF
jgi:hypothetical protein